TAEAMPVAFLGTYLAAVAVNAAGALLFLFLDIPTPPHSAADGPKGRDRGAMLRDPTIAVAMICGMVSYALMNLVMTSTPLAVVGCGFHSSDAADIVSAHVLAMFVPSFFTG
ncbi:MAG: MFS transporter, partial [Gemmobacter sp.]